MVQKRWFIGITLPVELSEAISGIQYSIFDEQIMLKPLIPHITLIHPNPLMELSPLYFAPLAKQATEKLLPCDITLESVGQFRSDVLYVSVKSNQLQKIYEALVAALPPAIQASYFVGKEFVPHVTIAQSKGRGNFSPELVDTVTSKFRTILPQTISAETLSRFEWQTSRNYTVKNL